jgi:hypothetical protein
MRLHIAGVLYRSVLSAMRLRVASDLDRSVSSAMRLQVASEFGTQRLISEATAWDKLG